MEEKEEKEMDEMFEVLKGMDGVVGEDTLIQLLCSFAGNGVNKKKEEMAYEGNKRLITAIAYLSSLTSQCGVIEKWKNAGLGNWRVNIVL